MVTRILARDGHHCSLCDLPLDRSIKNGDDPFYITFDHVIPRSKGGTDTLDNLRLAHQVCNNERGNDPLIEVEDEAA